MVTCAFSGRYARGLANGFTDRYDPEAPLGYPEVNQLTGAMRRAAIAAGDPHGTNLWAGTAWRRIRGAPPPTSSPRWHRRSHDVLAPPPAGRGLA